MYRRMMENCPSSSLPGYGPALLVKRPVRTRMQGVVGAGGEKPSGYPIGLCAISECIHRKSDKKNSTDLLFVFWI